MQVSCLATERNSAGTSLGFISNTVLQTCEHAHSMYCKGTFHWGLRQHMRFSLLKESRLVFRSGEQIGSDRILWSSETCVKRKSHVAAWEPEVEMDWQQTKVCIYRVLEHWLEVMRPCSSLTSLWKEIPARKVKDVNTSLVQQRLYFEKRRKGDIKQWDIHFFKYIFAASRTYEEFWGKLLSPHLAALYALL